MLGYYNRGFGEVLNWMKTTRPTSVNWRSAPTSVYTAILHATIFAADVEAVTAEVLACTGPIHVPAVAKSLSADVDFKTPCV